MNGATLRKLREDALVLTLREGARRLGLTENYLGRLERGDENLRVPPTTAILARIIYHPDFDPTLLDNALKKEARRSP